VLVRLVRGLSAQSIDKCLFIDYSNFMRTLEINKYIEDRQHLFWYSPSPKSETVKNTWVSVTESL